MADISLPADILEDPRYRRVAFTTIASALIFPILPDGARITRVVLTITTPYDNGAEITVQNNTDTFVTVGEVDSSRVGQYLIEQDGSSSYAGFATDGFHTVKVSNSPTVGAGTLFLEYTVDS